MESTLSNYDTESSRKKQDSKNTHWTEKNHSHEIVSKHILANVL